MPLLSWSQGQGLGKNLTGTTSHVKVTVKSDKKGIGAKNNFDDHWLETQDSMNDMFKNLSQNHNEGVDLSHLQKATKGEEIKKDKLSYDSVVTYKGKNWLVDFKDGKGRVKEPTKEEVSGIRGWDHSNEYTGEWKKKGYADNYH